MGDIFVCDAESLATSDDAVILSFGLARFKESWLEDLLGGDGLSKAKLEECFLKMVDTGLHLKFNVAEQVTKYHRSISESTIKWWSTQGDEAKLVLKPSAEDISIAQLPAYFEKWLNKNKFPKGRTGHMYTRGMIDGRWYQSILEKNLGIPTDSKEAPIKWWDFRDVRTAVDELLQQQSNGYMPKEFRPLVDFSNVNIKHNAMHDAAADAINVVVARIVAWA